MSQPLRIYSELAHWWPLFSPPSEYGEEAADILPALMSATETVPRTLLELGSGGGSLAFHLKRHFDLTLTDRSPQMLDVSRTLNPECEHVVGDMTSMSLDREFDRVLVHDAVMYLTKREEVQAMIRTAFRHCKPGGAVMILPDCVRETFASGSEHDGHDHPDGRGFRYLEWTWDSDRSDDTYDVAYAFILRDRDGQTHFEGEQHLHGCFARAEWLRWMTEGGFETTIRTDPFGRDVFMGVKR
jgi:SAM-dependent methyltransferase